jgi:hypothetical protein
MMQSRKSVSRLSAAIRPWAANRLWAAIRRAAAPVLIAGAVLVPVADARANDDVTLDEAVADTVKVEVLVLHASNQGKGVDPAIGKLPELGEPPFSSYNTYKLLSRSQLELKKNATGSTKLPNKSDLEVTYKGAAPPVDKTPRYALKASIKKPGGDSALRLLEVNAPAGKYFFVAGQPHDGGILVIGMKVLP